MKRSKQRYTTATPSATSSMRTPKRSALQAPSAWTPATQECTSRKNGSKTGKRSTLKPSSAKAKGRVLQQAVRDLILAKFDLEPDDVRSVSMGVSGEDLLFSPAARRKLPISVECKSRASISVYGHYQQAKDNARGYEPVLVIKQNRDKPLVVVDCVYFFDLLRRVADE